MSEGKDDGSAQAQGGGEGSQEEGGKPDYIEEKFWNAETKTVDVEGLSKSYSELGTKTREKTDDIRTTVIAELAADRVANRPKTADDYEVRVPDDLAKDMSEDMNFEFNNDDPMLVFWKEFAHEQGLDQTGFDAGLSAYIGAAFSNMPNFDTELKALGDNGAERVEHVQLWAKKNFDQETYNSMEQFATTAGGIKAMEAMMAKSGEPAFSPGGNGPAGAGMLTLNELRTMQADPRYWQSGRIDPEFVKKVDKGYEQLVGVG
jgi:hypothetical protein